MKRNIDSEKTKSLRKITNMSIGKYYKLINKKWHVMFTGNVIKSLNIYAPDI